mmetsp:Transcript_2908/g.4462  ORF Transcript_2908/g.4462 Transcript_2908/m.4462 type:complete len:656 (-) Transcript_2908:261-2228(-)
MGGHDCPATRYLIFSDEAAFVTTIFLFAISFVFYLLQNNRKWNLWLSSWAGGTGKKNGGMSIYGSLSMERAPSIDRAKTLQLDRYGTFNDKKQDTEERKGGLEAYAAAQTNISVKSKDGESKMATTTTTKKKRKARIHYFDNCRWWLETAVILKHTLEFFPPGGFTRDTSWWMEGISNYFETFFMAMFVFCSGFLSKGEMNARRAKRYLFRVWIPFVLINFINRGVDKGWSNWLDNFPSFMSAYDTSWFLACVIQWRMTVTFFATMTPKGRMAVALLLSWFSGYFFTATPTFHIAEFLSFLPFYLAGHMVTGEHVNMVRKVWIQRAAMVLSAIFFLGMMLFSFATFDSEETSTYGIRTFEGQREAMTIFTYSGYIKGWQRCHYFTTTEPSQVKNYWIVWCHRVVYQAMVWVMGLAFILMIPHDRRFYTESGGYTIYPYLLQVFFFALERNTLRFFTGHGIVPATNLVLWAVIIISIPFVNLLLSSYWCRKCWNLVFEPSWLDYFLFDTPNSTISAFLGDDISSNVQVTGSNTVRGTIREIADKEKLDPEGLQLYYKGQLIGTYDVVQTLEEASAGEITQVKSVYLEPRYLSMFHQKRHVNINAKPGYFWMDYSFSFISIAAILALIALTKGNPVVGHLSQPPTGAPTSIHRAHHK